jgi:N-acetylmuramoyl-L-alanine amidase
MILIAIDPGHGGHDRGASFRGVEEADVVLLVALVLDKVLISRGYETMLTRSTNEPVSLSERVATANRRGADLFISLHTNADPDPDEPGDLVAKGEEIWVCGSPKSKALAEAIEPHVDRIIPGHRFRGIKENSRFYVLRKTSMPAVLIELGFIDNVDEQATLSHPASYRNIAGFIADGIDEYATLNHLPGG